MDNIKMDMNTNQSLLHCVSSFEGTSYKNLSDTVTRFFISCFYQLLHQQILFFTSFPNFIQHYVKKDSRYKFPFFNRFTQIPTPYPLNSQNQLSVTKVFCQCSLTYHGFSRLLCYEDAQKELEQQSRTNIYFNPLSISGLLSSYKPLDRGQTKTFIYGTKTFIGAS